jgi:catechol-2,3-dioxygenase
MSVGASPPRPGRGAVGLYHLAWQVAAIEDLSDIAQKLAELDALTGMSDHGATKSLYGQDPDGIEFEVMWMVPREQWGEFDRAAVIRPLDLEREIQRWGQGASAS